MGKIANAVPRTAVEGRYRGKRNSTLTKTYKRHLLTIMAGMGMFNIIYSKNSPSSTGGRLSRLEIRCFLVRNKLTRVLVSV